MQLCYSQFLVKLCVLCTNPRYVNRMQSVCMSGHAQTPNKAMRLLKEPSICPSGHLCLLQWYQLQSACFYCACLCGCMYTFTQFHCLFLGLLFPSSSSTGSSPLSFSCSCVFLVGSLVNMLVCARKAQRCLWPLFA